MMLKSMYERADKPGPYRTKMVKLAKRLWLVVGGLLALLVVLSIAFGGGSATPTANSEYEAEILQNAGEEGSVTSTLTLEEGKALLNRLGTIHPDLAKPRELRDAREMCHTMQQGYADEAKLLWYTAQRFGNGNDRVFDDTQAAQILAEIRANGFCDMNGTTP